MECTGRYHEPMANALFHAWLFVASVNIHLIKGTGNDFLRTVKSGPADTKKIARYTLENGNDLHRYKSIDKTYT